MKKIILYFLLIVFPFFSLGQEKRDSLYKDVNGNPKAYRITGYESNSIINLLLDKETKWISQFNQVPSEPYKNNVFLGGTKKVTLETLIHKDSLKYYKYSIIENDSIYLVDNAIPDKIKSRRSNKSDRPNYVTVRLGELNIANKKITVQMYKLSQRYKVNTVVIYNPMILKPTIHLLKYSESVDLSQDDLKRLYTRYPDSNFLFNQSFVDGNTIISNDKTVGLGIQLKPTLFDFIYEVRLVRHGVNITEETVWISNDWKNSNLAISAQYFRKPGKYQIQVTPTIWNSIRTQNRTGWEIPSTAFNFEVLEPEVEFFSTKEWITFGTLFSVIIGAITGGLAVYIKNKQIKKKVAAEVKQKELAQLQLNSVRSQLNPHFLFNALAGIQNLMNKNEIDNANRYLTKFARLTRNVLDSKDLISLTEEKTLLDDYLQMEKLRFGFQYEITTSADLNAENIEIPSMLLQPFVENAVKHGIAEKGANGKIEVSFEKHSSDLVLKITDNGKGFDIEKTYSGLGLALSKNRISLLNTIYKDTPFVLNIQSDKNETTITVTLTQWL